MATILLKKRKLREAIEDGFQITPSSFDVKKRMDEHGEYKQHYESILPQLKTLFPDQSDDYLLKTLRSLNNDIVSTIEYLKYQKQGAEEKLVDRNANEFDEDVLSVLNQLSSCQNKTQAYDILSQFKTGIINNNKKEETRLQAENLVLGKVFKIQKNILSEENSKRQKIEEILDQIGKEIKSSQITNSYLLMQINQLESYCISELKNNHMI